MTRVLRASCINCAILVSLMPIMLPAEALATGKPRLDHIAVLTADLERTSAFLTNVLGFRRSPMNLASDPGFEALGGMKLAYVYGNGIWFELVEPTSRGPAMAQLENRGDGALIELDFEVDSLDEVYDELAKQGIRLVGMDGAALSLGQKSVLMEPYGLRLAYLPMDVSEGIPIELYERGPDTTDVLHQRDRLWNSEPAAAGLLPQLRYLRVSVKSLRRSRSFLVKNLQLSPLPFACSDTSSSHAAFRRKCAFLDGHGLWLRLEESPSALAADLTRPQQREAQLLELNYEVGDLQQFRRQMSEKGITLVEDYEHTVARSNNLERSESSRRDPLYFPLTTSCGMRIRVSQRGSPDFAWE